MAVQKVVRSGGQTAETTAEHWVDQKDGHWAPLMDSQKAHWTEPRSVLLTVGRWVHQKARQRDDQKARCLALPKADHSEHHLALRTDFQTAHYWAVPTVHQMDPQWARQTKRHWAIHWAVMWAELRARCLARR